MKKILLLLIPVLFLTGCTINDNKEPDKPSTEDFDTFEEFIPLDFDNDYGRHDIIAYDNNLDQNTNATVRVRAVYKLNGQVTYTLASGFVYSKNEEKNDYYIVTSASQIAYKSVSSNSVDLFYEGVFEVTLNDARKYKSDYIASYAEYDIALFKIHTLDYMPTAIIGDSDALRVGNDVSVIGTPNVAMNLINSYAKGVVSGLNRRGSSIYGNNKTLYTFPTFQFDAPTNMGMEGGIVMNDKFEVVGITSTKQHEDLKFESLSFAVAINDAKPIIEQLINNGKVDKTVLGFSGASIDFMNKVNWASELGYYSGIYVVDVIEDSKAKNAGLEKETLIIGISVNDNQKININNMEEFQSHLIRLTKDDVLTLYTVNSSNIKKVIKITI